MLEGKSYFDLKRILAILIGTDLIGLSVFFYGNAGTYKLAGMVKLAGSTYPIYWYYVHGPIVLTSIGIFSLGILIITLSRLKVNLQKILPFMVLSALVSVIIVTRVFYLGVAPIEVMLPLPAKTDEYVIQTFSAWEIVHGINPYTVNLHNYMLSVLPPQQYTLIYGSNAPPYTLNKVVGFVDFFDYLPQAALFYVPAVLLGMSGVVWNALVYSSGLFLSFRRMKGNSKYIFPAVIAGSMFIFLEPAVMPVPSAGWIVPLLIAVSYPDYPLLAGAMLGWASTFKIYVLPFSLFYLIEAKKMGYNVSKMIYGAISTAVFPTIPFLISDPKAMIKDVMAPLTLNLRPLDGGPGITSLQFLGIFIPKDVQTAILVTVLIAGLLLSISRKLGFVSFIIPSIAFFWWYRPEPQYFMYFPFIALIAVMTGFFGEVNINETRSELWMFSSFSIGLAGLSILFLAQYAFMTPNVNSLLLFLSILTVLFIIPLSLLIERSTRFIDRIRERFLQWGVLFFTTVGMLGISLAISAYFLNGLWYIVMGHNYESDAYLLMSLASQAISQGQNPYLFNFFHQMISDPNFGKLFLAFKYSNTPMDPSSLKPTPVFTPYYDPSGPYFDLGVKVNYVTFYDYPPGLAIVLAPAHLLNIPISFWESIMYSVSIVALFISIHDEKMMLYTAVALLSGIFISFFGEAFSSDITPWVSIIVLAIALRRIPILAGTLSGVAAVMMPEATVLIPFIWILIYFEMDNTYFKKFLFSSITAGSIITLPFLVLYPKTLQMMLFPIIFKLPVDGVSFSSILTVYLFHSQWPISSIELLPYIVFILSLIISLLIYYRLREGILLFPMFVIMTFTRANLEYMVFYPLLALFAWATVSAREPKHVKKLISINKLRLK
ncbi:hypothetical protein [Sulfuracidifex metallicus]|uniref:Uncharacterized protein n=2 Tax=Sulfuracidifex metallicus TaxID=47303 RepID=A0A6A9QIB0_SULME|nr:hypothetical protein [Sulfuracidifex metallicus]MUN29017.1 hypothetical protein [Sulfuracidifex metallicus DSM 6482 = JCM 9184]WOE50473.1 hypothetical protein RQ359_002005 [Sulfuracidifex metallicus DSM 6482 = JCM 9184]